eukprot:2577670-Prymnesium_polylepis.1
MSIARPRSANATDPDSTAPPRPAESLYACGPTASIDGGAAAATSASTDTLTTAFAPSGDVDEPTIVVVCSAGREGDTDAEVSVAHEVGFDAEGDGVGRRVHHGHDVHADTAQPEAAVKPTRPQRERLVDTSDEAPVRRRTVDLEVHAAQVEPVRVSAQPSGCRRLVVRRVEHARSAHRGRAARRVACRLAVGSDWLQRKGRRARRWVGGLVDGRRVPAPVRHRVERVVEWIATERVVERLKAGEVDAKAELAVAEGEEAFGVILSRRRARDRRVISRDDGVSVHGRRANLAAMLVHVCYHYSRDVARRPIQGTPHMHHRL